MYFEIIDKPSVDKMPTVCLNMIVKNESNVIVGTLNNLCKYINLTIGLYPIRGLPIILNKLLQIISLTKEYRVN